MSGSRPTARSGFGLWQVAQVGGVVLTFALLVGLFVAPQVALTLLWSVAVPLLPATFLLSPTIWRNVCPLATLNMLPARRGRRLVLPASLVPVAGVLGIVLLVVMVPARRVAFNADGPVLAVTIGLVAALALVLGLLADAKAGFCASICPVLPVERLYGQAPLLRVRHVRCPSCTACVENACMDLYPRRHLPHVLGTASDGGRWLRSGFGAFAAAFPGFVLGYWMTQDGPLASLGQVYMTVAGYSAASFVLVAIATLVLRPDARLAMPVLGAAAVALYYWFAAPAIVTDLQLPEQSGIALRVATLGLVALWLMRSLARHPAARRQVLRA